MGAWSMPSASNSRGPPGQIGQRCQTHLSANVADATPKVLHEQVQTRLHARFDAPDPETGCTLLARFVAAFEQTAPGAVTTLERGFDDVTAVLALPLPYRRRLRTTNGVERVNEEIRRRERVIRIFPNRASAWRFERHSVCRGL